MGVHSVAWLRSSMTNCTASPIMTEPVSGLATRLTRLRLAKIGGVRRRP